MNEQTNNNLNEDETENLSKKSENKKLEKIKKQNFCQNLCEFIGEYSSKMKIELIIIFILLVLIVISEIILSIKNAKISQQENNFLKRKFFGENKYHQKEHLNYTYIKENLLKFRQNYSLFIEFCEKGSFLYDNYFGKVNNPLISVIILLQKPENSNNYLLRLLRSIQNQSFQKLEIIIIDDSTNDKNINLIKNEMKKDKRIKLIKNPEFKGILQSRKIGILEAKGKYICFLDQGDLLNNNILQRAYKEAEGENIDILEFLNIRKVNEHSKHKSRAILSGKVTQPELKHFIFINDKTGFYPRIYPYMWGKLIKKELLINCLNKITDFYYNFKICDHEDNIISHLLFREGTSYKSFDVYGYLRDDTILNKTKDKFGDRDSFNSLVRDTLLFINFIYTNSDNVPDDNTYVHKIAEMNLNWISNNQKISINNDEKLSDLGNNLIKLINEKKLSDNELTEKVINILKKILDYNK